jgi:tungstate transport system ATP-binding protein
MAKISAPSVAKQSARSPAEHAVPADATAPGEAGTNMLVRLQSLRLTLGKQEVLKGLDAAIPTKPVTTVLGANGAGKSLLLRCLHGLIQPGAGQIVWPRVLRQAMVFQRPVLLRRSVRSNLAWALAAAGHADRHAPVRIDAMLERMALLELADRPARVLSGGEQQRLALARAWLLKPELLLLDEPCASVDPGSLARIEACLREMAQEGIRLVMSTHLLGQARRLSDQVIFLHDGQLAELTPAAEFFQQPRSPEARYFLEHALP